MPAIKKHQSLLDFALQYTGNAEGLFDVALLNGIGITDDVAPGTELKTVENVPKVIRYFVAEKLNVASEENAGSVRVFISFLIDSSPKPDAFKKLGERQALIDMAIQYCGDALKIFEIAALNGISITEDLAPGYPLFLPDAEEDKMQIVAAFKNLKPASKDDDDNVLNTVLDGIDYWIIEDDFIVQ